MGSSSVHVKEAVMIPPSDPTPSCVLSLSALDSQLFLRFTIEYLFVYRAKPGLDPCAVTARIKDALGKALVPYYPLAGRVTAKPDGSGLEVLCRAQGVIFIEAVCDDQSIADFERAPRYVSQWRKLLSFHVADVLKGAPPLVLQLTWLKDGNATLGVGVNHCISDGIGSAEFLNSFAELAKLGEIYKQKPVWDRYLLNPTSAKPPRLNHPEFNRVPDLSSFSTRFSSERLLTPTSITFEKRNLNELKKLALSTTRLAESTFTSFEVLSAHVWRSWARSLNLPQNQILKLLFSINVRDRVKPSLPRGFYGNAFVLGCAQSSVKELEQKGLGYATMLVKRAKERVDSEYVKSVVELVSGGRASPDPVGVLILSQWSRLGLETVDFGTGRPVHVGPVCCDKYCLVLPVCNRAEALKVMLAVPSNCADKYEGLIRNLYS